MLAHYTVNDGQLVQTKSKTSTLEIEQGWYVLHAPDKKGRDVFRLKRINDSNWLMMSKTNDAMGLPELTYSWVRRENGMFFVHSVQGKTFAEWASKTGVGSGWRLSGDNAVISSAALLERAYPTMIEAGLTGTPSIYRAIEPSPEAVELRKERARIDAKIAQIEKELKKLCGGRVCKDSKSGKEVYRTETYNPPMWYYEDGRLAPEEDWPR